MRGNIRIHYETAGDERLQVVLGETALDLHRLDGGWWGGAVDLADAAGYLFRVVAGDAAVSDESGPPRRAHPSWTDGTTIVDRWRPPDSTRLARSSSFFSRSRSSLYPATAEAAPAGLRFELHEPWVPVGKVPAIVGSIPHLGSWDAAGARPLDSGPYPRWVTSIDVPDGGFEYKYVLLGEDGSVEWWEEGANRTVPHLDGGAVVVRDEEMRGMPGWRGAGIAVPVFSLRSERSVGVGQFTDLIPFADWAAAAGFSVIQLLPVNDTVLTGRWDDSYPYNPVSVHALHPLYIDLGAIEGARIDASIAAARDELDGLAEIDYPAVMGRKLRLLRTAFDNLQATLATDDEFTAFVAEQWHWLGPYSAWSVNRDRHGSPDFSKWGAASRYALAKTDRMATPAPGKDYDDLQFYWFVQFHLHRQLNRAADHARSRGIGLKGDLPIGVSPMSAEVWTRPDQFHADTQTGAPPDAFARRGQNWGFPTYDWDQMDIDGFDWWRSRLSAFSEYVDLYRIDHVLGFFRIWEIPGNSLDGTLGRFRPCLPLTPAELHDALGDVDIAELTRPVLSTEAIAERFGERAADITRVFFAESSVPSQADAVAAFGVDACEDLAEAEEAEECRRLLDLLGDVLLIEVGGGYSPAISWTETTAYRLLSPDQQESFDALAVDFFHRRHAMMWEEQGRRILPAVVGASDMLVCGEDLGMVPDVVPRVMNEMGLLSLEIERMPKRMGEWIADPADAPYLSVVSPGTHDTATLRQWWEEDRAYTERYWEGALGQLGEAPAAATPDVITRIIERQLASPAMLCIIPIADVLALRPGFQHDDPAGERINDPADRHNRWRYRMRPGIDDLDEAVEFTKELASLIRQSGR